MYYNMIMQILIILIILYLAAIYPNTTRKSRLKPYEERYIAHRGLFNNEDIPENSLPAFKKAVTNGYGIELDVQLTTDDQLVVFHDASLKRICGIEKNLIDCDYAQLQKYRLLNTDEKIPLFADVLKVLKKTTPLIIEIKPEGRYIETTKKVVAMMKDYDGLFNIESFNPLVVLYLKRHHPEIIRGQLSYNSLADKEAKANIFFKFICTNLLFNFLNKPDYIAYDCRSVNNPSFMICSLLYKAECVAWTIKSPEELEKVRKYYRCFIFDSFIPQKQTIG